VLWAGLAWLAVLAARGPGLLPGQDAAPAGAMAAGDPGWLRSLGEAAPGLAGRHAAVVTLVTVALFAVIAAGVYLPVPAARAVLCLAVLAAVAMWAAGQDLGGLFTRATTDPGTAPLLILLAAAYWPLPRPAPAPERGQAAGRSHTAGSPEPRPLAGVRPPRWVAGLRPATAGRPVAGPAGPRWRVTEPARSGDPPMPPARNVMGGAPITNFCHGWPTHDKRRTL
jgi:hypothetical protein